VSEETLTLSGVEVFVAELENVWREVNRGISLFIANSNNDFGNMSNFDREAVFRINFGVSKEML